MKGKQLNLADTLAPGQRKKAGLTRRISHGGTETTGKRKSARPYSPKAAVHVVLRASRARGAWSMKHRKNESNIAAMVYMYAARFNVRVYRFANVGNHLHLLVKSDERKQLADYLRVLAGRVAISVSGARKYVKSVGKFWDHLCWSRLIKWGAEFYKVEHYVFKNELEAIDPRYRELVLNEPYLIPD